MPAPEAANTKPRYSSFDELSRVATTKAQSRAEIICEFWHLVAPRKRWHARNREQFYWLFCSRVEVESNIRFWIGRNVLLTEQSDRA